MNVIIIAMLSAVFGSNDSSPIIMPPFTAEGQDIAIVWIHGADCNNAAYQDIASVVQYNGQWVGQRIWVGIPEFIFDVPEPLLIDYYVDETIKSLRTAGFTGDNILIAGHSLGGIMTQDYANKNKDIIKGQFLMGSVLTRDKRKIQDNGTTHYNYDVPTLTIGGTKDGLMRISRVAESFWHSYINIESPQVDLFPVVALEGVSHMGFMSGKPPAAVAERDLVMDVTEHEAHQMVATVIVQFMDQIIMGNRSSINTTATATIVAPLLQAMEYEGFYNMKSPCYAHDLVGPTNDPTCLHGAPWHDMVTQRVMGGDLNSKVTLVNDDNFHRVDSINPVHLPIVNTSCDANPSKHCELDSITVSENIYDTLDSLDTGYYPIAASEMKTKISSRQRVQEHAGHPDADFHQLDEVGNRCADINQYAIIWAYQKLSTTSRKLYDTYGVKMVVGDDLGPYNAGPLWIWTYMSYTKNLTANTYTVKAPMMRTPTDYFISSAAGFHYCKVLSPFKALEWMMVDGLFDHNGINNYSKKAYVQ